MAGAFQKSGDIISDPKVFFNVPENYSELERRLSENFKENAANNSERNMSDILGTPDDFVLFIEKTIGIIDIGLDWFQDLRKQQILLQKGLINEIVKSLEIPDHLKSFEFDFRQGLSYFQLLYQNPEYLKDAQNGLDNLKGLKDKLKHSYLYFYNGMLKFYYEFNYSLALDEFKKATFYSNAFYNKKIKLDSHYEYAKILHLMRYFSDSLVQSDAAFKTDENFKDALFLNTKTCILLGEDIEYTNKIEKNILSLLKNNEYYIKILFDNDFLHNKTVINTLVKMRDEMNGMFRKEFETFRNECNNACSIHFPQEVKSIEDEMNKNTISGCYFAQQKCNNLKEEVNKLRKKNIESLQSLTQNLNYYKSSLFNDSLNLKEFELLVSETQSKINNYELAEGGFFYEFSALESEYEKIKEIRDKDSKKYPGFPYRKYPTEESYYNALAEHIKELNKEEASWNKNITSGLENLFEASWVFSICFCLAIAAMYYSSSIRHFLNIDEWVDSLSNFGVVAFYVLSFLAIVVTPPFIIALLLAAIYTIIRKFIPKYK
ncbi:MAG: hypothetical protein QM737_19870 [Ferruginibacter sp.]